MKSRFGEGIIAGAFLIVSVLVVPVAIGLVKREHMLDTFRAQAIDQGYALYCPENGKFAWKGECNKDNEGE